jgi:electron transport complex protein RnfC
LDVNLFRLFKRHATFAHGGVHPSEHKKETAGLPIRRLPFAPQLVVPLSQHKGAPAKPIVKVGEEVVRGEPIAEADGHVSVPMHAPATGRVVAVDLWPTAEGPKAPAIVIEPYDAASQEILYEDPVDIMNETPGEIVHLVKEAGLVGLGGAAFPSHVKMLPPTGKSIHTVIVNGCECEPYLTCDHRVMLEKTDALLRGVRIAMRATGAKRAMIGIEDNKMDAVQAIRQKLPENDAIEVKAVKARYPQGAEKMLIESLLKEQIPEGGFPVDLGVAVYNVGTLAQMGELLPSGRGLIERVVTVSGAGVDRPGNYLVPIGTPVGFLLHSAGVDTEANKVILGGPMMGMTVASLEVPITKGVSGVVVYAADESDRGERKVYPCIKCSRCVETCPMRLNPSMMALLAQKREYERMESEFHLNQCFECGCCAYVCPSNIPLTQYFRIAKAINRERPALAS